MAMDLGDRIAQAYAQNLSTLAAGAGNSVAALSEAVALRRPLGVLPAGPGGRALSLCHLGPSVGQGSQR